MTIELAAYTARTPDLDASHLDMHAYLRGCPGYVDSLALRGLEDPRQRADLVLWTDAAHARAAAAAFPEAPESQAFLPQIDSLRVFSHYSGAMDGLLTGLRAHPLVELAAMPRTPTSAPWGEKVHAVLEDLDTVGGHARLFGLDEETPKAPGAVDVIGWASPDAMQAAPPQVLARYPELAPMFEGDPSALPLFELYTRVEPRG